MHTFKKGDQVQTWFDTQSSSNHGRARLLYGEVIAAGPMAYRVRWESGLTNRVRQGDTNVVPRETH